MSRLTFQWGSCPSWNKLCTPAEASSVTLRLGTRQLWRGDVSTQLRQWGFHWADVAMDCWKRVPSGRYRAILCPNEAYEILRRHDHPDPSDYAKLERYLNAWISLAHVMGEGLYRVPPERRHNRAYQVSSYALQSAWNATWTLSREAVLLQVPNLPPAVELPHENSMHGAMSVAAWASAYCLSWANSCMPRPETDERYIRSRAHYYLDQQDVWLKRAILRAALPERLKPLADAEHEQVAIDALLDA